MSVRDQVGGQGSQRQMVWASKEMKPIDVTNRSIFDLWSLKNIKSPYKTMLGVQLVLPILLNWA